MVHDCRRFSLDPAESRNISISFKPDFSASQVKEELVVSTSQGLLSFPLLASVPHQYLPLCSNSQPQLEFETVLQKLLLVVFCIVLLVLLSFTAREYHYHGGKYLLKPIAILSNKDMAVELEVEPNFNAEDTATKGSERLPLLLKEPSIVECIDKKPIVDSKPVLPPPKPTEPPPSVKPAPPVTATPLPYSTTSEPGKGDKSHAKSDEKDKKIPETVEPVAKKIETKESNAEANDTQSTMDAEAKNKPKLSVENMSKKKPPQPVKTVVSQPTPTPVVTPVAKPQVVSSEDRRKKKTPSEKSTAPDTSSSLKPRSNSTGSGSAPPPFLSDEDTTKKKDKAALRDSADSVKVKNPVTRNVSSHS